MVADVTRMGEWSPENEGAVWLARRDRPGVGREVPRHESQRQEEVGHGYAVQGGFRSRRDRPRGNGVREQQQVEHRSAGNSGNGRSRVAAHRRPVASAALVEKALVDAGKGNTKLAKRSSKRRSNTNANNKFGWYNLGVIASRREGREDGGHRLRERDHDRSPFRSSALYNYGILLVVG